MWGIGYHRVCHRILLTVHSYVHASHIYHNHYMYVYVYMYICKYSDVTSYEVCMLRSYTTFVYVPLDIFADNAQPIISTIFFLQLHYDFHQHHTPLGPFFARSPKAFTLLEVGPSRELSLTDNLWHKHWPFEVILVNYLNLVVFLVCNPCINTWYFSAHPARSDLAPATSHCSHIL